MGSSSHLAHLSDGKASLTSEAPEVVIFPSLSTMVYASDEADRCDCQSLLYKLANTRANGLEFAAPNPSLVTSEFEVARGILQILQGVSSSLFRWDEFAQKFITRDHIYILHLSRRTLDGILSQFLHAASCLQRVELFVKKVLSSERAPPTLRAFANTVSIWLKRLRDTALKEEMRLVESNSTTVVTLLVLASVFAGLCSGAEYLFQVVYEVIPAVYFECESDIRASEMAVHILDHLYEKLDEACYVHDGEECAYHMLLVLFMGSLLPYLEMLDSWLFDGTLDDPFEEMFFYLNTAVAIDQSAFWEKSCALRTYGTVHPFISSSINDGDHMTNGTKVNSNEDTASLYSLVRGNSGMTIVCPLFLKGISRSVVSAGKSLQLIHHTSVDQITCLKVVDFSGHVSLSLNGAKPVSMSFPELDKRFGDYVQRTGRLTLPEVFCASLIHLVGDGAYGERSLRQEDLGHPKKDKTGKSHKRKHNPRIHCTVPAGVCSGEVWHKGLIDAVSEERFGLADIKRDNPIERDDLDPLLETVDAGRATDISGEAWEAGNNNRQEAKDMTGTFFPENPAISVWNEFLKKNNIVCDKMDLCGDFILPPLNDQDLRESLFGENSCNAQKIMGESRSGGTNYIFGFQFSELEYLRLEEERRALKTLFPFPTLLPCVQDYDSVLDFLPFQKSSTLTSGVLRWIQRLNLKAAKLPIVIVHECIVNYIKKQVLYIGHHILLMLVKNWRLMDELGVLRGIYLLGSGDLLQQFISMLFNKLDRGDTWDDEFELNTTLQESIRNSSDGSLLSASDCLVVSIMKTDTSNEGECNSLIALHRGQNNCFGIDALDLLNFTYKVSWPLELIVNAEAIGKYNQVMGFLLKVKRAKFVLDKVRRWMWKDESMNQKLRKRHLLMEQKLLHFVDAFHQYVMDRVFHYAWLDLCDSMASAGSLDEVIEIHDAYLLSIQRLCFVAPDKLGALLATRIRSILKLALDFYSIQQTIGTGVATPAVRASCEKEVERIEKQFDECIILLLRVLSFKLNVGHYPHLVDLVARINYNYFYMSHGGSLVSVAHETNSKIGRTL